MAVVHNVTPLIAKLPKRLDNSLHLDVGYRLLINLGVSSEAIIVVHWTCVQPGWRGVNGSVPALALWRQVTAAACSLFETVSSNSSSSEAMCALPRPVGSELPLTRVCSSRKINRRSHHGQHERRFA